MIGSISRIKNEQGFSMAEVVVAVVLFVASILGVSVMLVSGGQNVTVGAKESAAANLANKKIEEVKALPFYRAWDGTPHDIDDFYWAYSSGTPMTNAQQRANPVVEDYGSIPGYSSYKRTTSVTYEYLNGSNVLADAVMDPNWRPKAPGSGQFDRPTGGTVGSYSTLHAVQIEVKVYYRTDSGAEKQYSAQGLAGDLMVTGGTNTPPLIINSITPTYGFYMNDTNLQMTITVQSNPTAQYPLTASNVDAFLWYPGCSDVHATPGSYVVNTSGTQITCGFDLRPANGIRVGQYNLAVKWLNRGFTATFRDNIFEVKAPPPVFTGISNFNWGFRAQTARQITITGNDLWEATANLKGPDGGATLIPGSTVVSGDGHTVTATFNLVGDAASRPNNTHWDVVLVTAGGTVRSSDVGQSFWLNPPPVFTRVSATSDPNWYNWAWKTQTSRKVRIEGQYLYGLGPISTARTSTISWSTMTSSNASFYSGPDGNSCNDTDPVVLTFNPDSAIHAGSSNYHSEVANTYWNVNILGCGADVSSTNSTQQVLMNPAPQVSSISGLISGYRKTGNVSTVTINGSYFQDSVGFYLINNNGTYPSGADQTCIIGYGGTTNSAGTQITGIVENLDKASFHDWLNWNTLLGTSAAFNSTTYVTLLQNGNYDWQSVWPAYTASISHAPIALTYGSYTWGYNQWDIGVAMSGAWLYPGETSIALYTTGGDYAAANPSSTATLTGYTTSGYGSSQTVSSCVANALALPQAAYKIKVWDNENGKVASTQSDATVANQAPTGTMTDARQGTNVGIGSSGTTSTGWPSYTGSATVTVSSTISGMRGLYSVSGVTWNSPMWYASTNYSCTLGFCGGSMSYSNPGNYTFTATGVTLNANRSAKTLTVTYNIGIFPRHVWTAFHKGCTFTSCDDTGYNKLDYKQSASGGGDVNNITLTGGWGSTVKNSPNIVY
jgi:hypothetical protein